MRSKRAAQQQVERAIAANRAVYEALSYVLLEVAHVLEEHTSATTCCTGNEQCKVVAGLAPLAERADAIIAGRLSHYEQKQHPLHQQDQQQEKT